MLSSRLNHDILINTTQHKAIRMVAKQFTRQLKLQVTLTPLLVGDKYSAHGVVGSLIAAMLWNYYASTVLFFGAEKQKCRLHNSVAHNKTRADGSCATTPRAARMPLIAPWQPMKPMCRRSTVAGTFS